MKRNAVRKGLIREYAVKAAAYFNLTIDTDILDQLQTAVEEFELYTNGEEYCNRKKYSCWKNRYAFLGADRSLKVKHYLFQFIPGIPGKDLLFSFYRYYHNGEQEIKKYNRQFVSDELQRSVTLFDTIEKYPLDIRQREAVVHDEDNNLIIAGAGTGKTTTIVGKYVYLIERLGIDPDSILLLAFTEKAAREMQARITDRMQRVLNKEVDVQARTFHSLGLGIISEVYDYKPDLQFDSEIKLRTFIREIYGEIAKDESYRKLLVDYLIEYLKPYKPPESFRSKGEYFAYLRANNILTLQREEVKSYEEAQIANFLFLHNINYEYEVPYKHTTRSKQYRQYRPDFYLPDYDIYIEHWGVDRKGGVPEWFGSKGSESATEVYQSKMEWARELHRMYGTTLVETFSYEKREGILNQNLRRKLEKHRVRFERKNSEDILRQYEDAKEIPLLINLIVTFLNLFKANRYSQDQIIEKTPDDQRERARAFLKIFQPIYEKYETHLRSNDSIDFSDMIAQATQYVRENKHVHRYNYILIDEFQDISAGRYALMKAMLDQNRNTKLFCVGDDWQSIYRFTGADVTIMTNFRKHFGYTHEIILDKTYRYNDKILHVSSDFIQRNPIQIKKKLKTENITQENPIEIIYADRRNEDETILTICRGLNEQAAGNKENISVFIISRYNFNKPSNLDEIQRTCSNLTVEAITAHKSKGLEADHVILKSVVSGVVGFPCGMTDDPIVSPLLSEPEHFDHAEERRLFYVALTRTRGKLTIISSNTRPSPFIRELDPDGISNTPCPDCLTGVLVKRSGSGGEFTGCTNYPYCRYSTH